MGLKSEAKFRRTPKPRQPSKENDQGEDIVPRSPLLCTLHQNPSRIVAKETGDSLLAAALADGLLQDPMQDLAGVIVTEGIPKPIAGDHEHFAISHKTTVANVRYAADPRRLQVVVSQRSRHRELPAHTAVPHDPAVRDHTLSLLWVTCPVVCGDATSGVLPCSAAHKHGPRVTNIGDVDGSRMALPVDQNYCTGAATVPCPKHAQLAVNLLERRNQRLTWSTLERLELGEN
mmetsp:Transcript_11851/g.21391  ORF Transcript_11851/g.21391 Transcript_11851/m.21391 type:complete len:232 (+) Transcript_11851:79-774(+)